MWITISISEYELMDFESTPSDLPNAYVTATPTVKNAELVYGLINLELMSPDKENAADLNLHRI